MEIILKYIEEQRCPICHQLIKQSDYLKNEFENDSITLWLVNLITHYRHNHITSWNKCWERNGRRYRKNWFSDYKKEKAKVNERAKRQLIRKGYAIMKGSGVTSKHFSKFSCTETMEVAKKFLD